MKGIAFILSVFMLLMSGYAQAQQEEEDRIIFKHTVVWNILEVYQLFYRDVHPTRFIYDKEVLDSLNSIFFNGFGIFMSGEDLYFNRTKVINEWNSKLGLETRVLEKETDVFILDSISVVSHALDTTITGNYIKTWGMLRQPYGSGFEREKISTINHLSKFQLSEWYSRTGHIVGALQEFFKVPIESKLPLDSYFTDYWDININIETEYEDSVSDRVNLWIDLLKEVGLNLRIERRIEKFVEIKNASR